MSSQEPEHTSTHTEIKARKRRDPGFTARDSRVEEWLELERMSLRSKHEDWTEAEIAAVAQETFDEIRRTGRWQRLLEIFEQTKPISTSFIPSTTTAMVELAAMTWLGPIRWLIAYLQTPTNRRGKAAQLGLVIAVLLQMTFGRARMQIASAYEELTSSNPLVGWAHDYPDSGLRAVSIKTLYQSLEKELELKDPDVCFAINIDLLKQLAAQVNQGEFPRARGGTRKKEERLLIGEIGVIDGSLVSAPVQQVSPRNADHKARLHGDKREMVTPTQYVDEDGKVYRFVVGYRELVLADMASGLILGSVTMPANGDERAGLLALLAKIFALWPACPMRAIVGDSLFQHSKALAHDLVFKWGIQPIFPTRKGDYAEGLPFAETEGVPHCQCGEMKLRDAVDFYTADRRALEGIPRGVEAPTLDARIRWECPNKLCKPQATRPFKEPRLYTFYPRRGNHQRAIEREVFMHRRNCVESIFASLQRLGFGRDRYEAPAWADDDQVDWIFRLGALALTARRVVHETGLYDFALKEAEDLDLMTQPNLSKPAPGPDHKKLETKRKARQQVIDPPIAPQGYEHFDVGPGVKGGSFLSQIPTSPAAIARPSASALRAA